MGATGILFRYSTSGWCKMLNPVKMCCNSQQKRPETNLLYKMYVVRIGEVQYEEGSKMSDCQQILLELLVFNT